MGENDHCYFSGSSSDHKMSSEQVIMSANLLKLELYILHDYQIILSFLENKQTRPRFLALANFTHYLPSEKPHDVANTGAPNEDIVQNHLT